MCSAEAVRYWVKQRIEWEDPADVFSDDEIVKTLTGYGIEIARRIVAKYRETSTSLPASNAVELIGRAECQGLKPLFADGRTWPFAVTRYVKTE